MWKDILGYEGLYQVSDSGEVRSLDRFCTGSRFRWLKGKTLKQTKTTTGYNKVELCKDGKAVSKRVHRLVATAFIDNPDDLPCINHIDNNPSNNNVSNLEWCTQRENVIHAVCIGARGKTSHPRIATDEVIEAVLDEYIPYDREHSIRAISRRLGIPDATIYAGITRYKERNYL